MSDALADALVGAVEDATKRWKKQKKAEERNASAQRHRREAMTRYRELTIKEVAFAAMESAYLKASAGGTLPAHARQIMYAARPEIQRQTGKELKSEYFTQTLLPDYMTEYPSDTASWNVVFDARGHFKEPFTDTTVDLGTIGVRNYVGSLHDRGEQSEGASATRSKQYPTKGPANRYGAVLFVEKEGFMPLFDEVKLAEKYDLAIMSTKGMSNTASRELVDDLCGRGLRLFVLHDFDKAGFSICGTLRRSNRRYHFDRGHAQQVIDLGLRLADVEEYGLESEGVWHKSNPDHNLSVNGATAEEIAVLRHSRVELNAFASDQLIEWIEAKLEEHEVEKVVPDALVLIDAYQRALRLHLLDREMERAAGAVQAKVDGTAIPGGLAELVRAELDDDNERSWDDVIAELAEKAMDQ
jgi:hypothetical protein